MRPARVRQMPFGIRRQTYLDLSPGGGHQWLIAREQTREVNR